MRGENASGNAKAQHEGVLRRSDMEEAEELEAEAVVIGGGLVLIAVLKDLSQMAKGSCSYFQRSSLERSETGVLNQVGSVSAAA